MFILLLWHVCSSQRENVTLDEISCKLSTCNNTLEKLVVTLHGQFTIGRQIESMSLNLAYLDL